MRLGKILAVFTVVAAVVGGSYYFYTARSKPTAGALKRVVPEIRDIIVRIQATGVIEPENRVSILPPVAGRVDDVLVDEGDAVKRGQRVAVMSSTNRAALVDLAKARPSADRNLLENTYLPTSVFAPVAGQIITRAVVAGQTVSQTTVLFELSDRLIVRAEVDETDLGGIILGMTAQVTIDAFRDLTIDAKVLRIAHQSKIVNNINVYDVLLAMSNPAASLRSGMTANISFLKDSFKGVVTLPVWALQAGDGKTSTLHTESGEVLTVKLGASDGQYTQVDGIGPDQAIYIQDMVLKEKNGGGMFGPKTKPRAPGMHP
jgi:macrolide-specific efflux system membrane fusion protein